MAAGMVELHEHGGAIGFGSLGPLLQGGQVNLVIQDNVAGFAHSVAVHHHIARDLQARIAAHNAGTGARYTRGRRPVSLVYSEPASGRSEASRREFVLKRLTRTAKQRLIAANCP